MGFDKLTWTLTDAVYLLKEYMAYAEEMRKLGRGFHPTTPLGLDTEFVISNAEEAIAETSKFRARIRDIKYYRLATNCSLLEAKDAIELHGSYATAMEDWKQLQRVLPS